jgi:hypothetical protein
MGMNHGVYGGMKISTIPARICKNPELNGNLEMPRGPLEERRHTASKILQ